jgi:hypothetical protein
VTKVLYIEHDDDNLYMLKTRFEWIDDWAPRKIPLAKSLRI